MAHRCENTGLPAPATIPTMGSPRSHGKRAHALSGSLGAPREMGAPEPQSSSVHGVGSRLIPSAPATPV